MQKVLVEAGVDKSATRVLTYGREVIFEILDFCEPGDLLLLLTGLNEGRKVPGYIGEYMELRDTREERTL